MLASRLLQRALTPMVTTGALVVIAADGERLEFGDGAEPRATARFHDAAAQWAVLLDPDLKTGEMFTDGRLTIEQGTVYDFLALVLQNSLDAEDPWFIKLLDRWRMGLSRWRQRNLAGRSRRNVAHHYDLGDDLYALFLDPDWQYSCAYFEHPGQSLADAQLAKKRHVAAKLALRSGDRVLDIGCGWGGMACYLAETAQAGEVVGVTLSEEQIAAARERTAARGLDGRVSFQLQDYRAVQGRFDRIVSVGMFEHVGLAFYETFFKTCRRLLADDGVMLLHTIGTSDEPCLTNPWVTKHIFPGGHLPSLSDIVSAVERNGLTITDVEVLRLHYADTLRAWREAFMARRAQASALFDERFCRMWEFYLALSEAAFRHQDIVVFQLQIARRPTAAPLTRDYIAAAEAELREREGAAGEISPRAATA